MTFATWIVLTAFVSFLLTTTIAFRLVRWMLPRIDKPIHVINVAATTHETGISLALVMPTGLVTATMTANTALMLSQRIHRVLSQAALSAAASSLDLEQRARSAVPPSGAPSMTAPNQEAV